MKPENQMLQTVSLKETPERVEKILSELTQCDRFRPLSKAHLSSVLQHSNWHQSPAQATLAKKGMVMENLCILLSGTASMEERGEWKHCGDVLAEGEALFQQAVPIDLIAKSACEWISIPLSLMKDEDQLPAAPYRDFHYQLLRTFPAYPTPAAALPKQNENFSSVSKNETPTDFYADASWKSSFFLDQLVKAGPQGVAAFGIDGKLLFANQQILRSILYLNLQPATLSLEALAKQFDTNTAEWSADFALKNALNETWAMKTEKGNYFFFISMFPIFDDNGAHLGAVMSTWNITKQVSQKTEIEKLQEQFSNALENLDTAFQEVESTNVFKSETLQRVTTELSPPVLKILSHATVIDANLQTADIDEPFPQEKIEQEALKIIHQADFLHASLKDLEYLIQLQQEITTAPVFASSITDVVEEIKKQEERLLNQKKVTVKMAIPATLSKSKWEPQQLGNVLQVLIKQALLVCKEQSTIDIQINEIPEKENEVSVVITYQGPNLSKLQNKLAVNDEYNIGEGHMQISVGIPLLQRVIFQCKGDLEYGEKDGKGRIALTMPMSNTVLSRLDEQNNNRVMIFDQNEVERDLIKGIVEHLWPGAEIITEDQPYEFLEKYTSFKPHLVVIDPSIDLPSWHNHRLLASLTSQHLHNCPMLVVSELYNDFAERGLAVERGASDFLAKPYSVFDLQFKMRTLLTSSQKETQWRLSIDEAKRQASTDGLTQIANRKHFDEFLSGQVMYSKRADKPCSLIMIDMDNFKHYNDFNGHQAGDHLLQALSLVLKTGIRSSDLAARYGGEEFMVVLPETSKSMAAIVAEKLRKEVEKIDGPGAADQPKGYISGSFGVASYPEDGDTPEKLIEAADGRLYIAKEQGRNCVILKG